MSIEDTLILQLVLVASYISAGIVVCESVSVPSTLQISSIFENIVSLTCISSSFRSCRNFGKMCYEVFFFPIGVHKHSKEDAKESI